MIRLWFVAIAAVLAGFVAIEPRPAGAQGPGLGGYGASSSMAAAGMGGSGPIIPYGGSLRGFMPYRMAGGGTGLTFSSRNSSPIESGRISFRLLSMNRSMSMSSAAFGGGLGRRPRGSLFSPMLGGGMSRSMDTGSESVMPPNFGYPFYQPPSLLWPSSAFVGMSSM